ncbi:MAG: dihydrofolate reductase, partial [Herbinix sp.]|nr:dihydrofolate reductase [Herbinix sp.]
PDLDKMGDWHITGESDEQTYHDLVYAFYKYERKK